MCMFCFLDEGLGEFAPLIVFFINYMFVMHVSKTKCVRNSSQKYYNMSLIYIGKIKIQAKEVYLTLSAGLHIGVRCRRFVLC